MPAIHRGGLHWLLWERSDVHRRLVTVDQKALAEQLGVNRQTVNRVLARMVNEGRIDKIAGTGPESREYKVVDPAEWQPPVTQ